VIEQTVSGSFAERKISDLLGGQRAARGECGLEGLGAHRGAQALAVEFGQLAFQRFNGVAQIDQGLGSRAVQPGGPARVGSAVAGQGQADQRVGGVSLHPCAHGQVE